MPPKKNVPKAPKVAPKAPVGRPRKKLGTRVSDVPVVSTIKPMPRRANIDSMILQRARLMFKRQYKKNISEDQARAFLDAMSAPKRGPIGETILGNRDDSRLRTAFIQRETEDGAKFIELVKRAKTGFKKDPKGKVSLKVSEDGKSLILSVPGFEPEPANTPGLGASTIQPVPDRDYVTERHWRRVADMSEQINQLRTALAADPTNPDLIRTARRLQKQYDRERAVVRPNYPATASPVSTPASSVGLLSLPSSLVSSRASSRSSSRSTSGYATPIAADERDIVDVLLGAEEPAAPAAPIPVPAAVDPGDPPLVDEMRAEARVTDPAGRPRRVRSRDLIRGVQRLRAERAARDPGDPEIADDNLEAHAARLDPDGSLRRIARLAELAQQRGPLPPPVAVSTSRRPSRQDAAQAAATALLTQVPARLMEQAARARDQVEEEEDEATRQRIDSRIRQRQVEEQAAELARARARLDASNRQELARSALLGQITDLRNRDPRSSDAAHIAAVYRNQQETQLALARERIRIENERAAREAAALEAALDQQALDEYAQMDAARRAAREAVILQPGTPVQSESRYATAPSSVSGYATPMTEEQIRQARRHRSAAVARMSRSFSELEAGPRREGPNQDLEDLMDARNAVVAARQEVARQQAENDRLYQQQEQDKALLFLQDKALREVETQRRIAEQAALELGEPVPVQRNVPTTTADAFSQGWANAFPSANIPPPPAKQAPPAKAKRAPAKKKDVPVPPNQPTIPEQLAVPAFVKDVIQRAAIDESELQAQASRLRPAEERKIAKKVAKATVQAALSNVIQDAIKARGDAMRKDDDDSQQDWGDEDEPKLIINRGKKVLAEVDEAQKAGFVDPEEAENIKFALEQERKLSGKGLRLLTGSALPYKKLMKALKKARYGKGYFDGYKSLTYNIHGTPDDNKKDLAAAKAAYAAKGGRMNDDRTDFRVLMDAMKTIRRPNGGAMGGAMGGSIVLSGVPTPTGSGADADQYKLHFVAFPDDKWTTSSSLRWIRSNGIVPIKKAMHIPEYYKYQILPPSNNKDYMTHELISRGRKILLGYARP